MQIKKTWKQVDGVLLLDKPLGMSSNDALQKARRLFSAAKGGHTGTLDPLASGLLPLCFGEATKFSADLLDADKTYVAMLKLGVRTESGDAEGAVIAMRPVTCSQADVEAALARFSGEIDQVPPMTSALKRDGRPLYELARQGITVEREARRVRIHAIRLLSFAGDAAEIEVRCSKGTYIRVLGDDIGEVLGCGAHLSALRRTGVADLTLAGAHTLAALEALADDERLQCLAPVDALLQSLPRIDLSMSEGGERFSHGNPAVAVGAPCAKIRVYIDGKLAGVGERKVDGKVYPKRLVQLAP